MFLTSLISSLFVFQISGIVLIVIGALQHSTYSQFGNFAGSGLSKISVVLIAVGVTIVLVSILGHVGAFMENTSILGGVSIMWIKLGKILHSRLKQ